MVEEKQVEAIPVVPVTPQEEQKVQIGYFQEDSYLICRIPLTDLHLSMGIAYDFLCEIRDRLTYTRAAEQKRRQELMGGDTLRKGAQQDRSFWNKHFSK